MSEAFIVRRGGGSTKLFAAIGVSYPAGSSCTCTDGVKSFTAKDTSGKWVFVIPYAGTWTVTATDGTNTKSETVEITAQGESVNVSFSFEQLLYDSGNEFSDTTGGWNLTSYGYGAATKKNETSIRLGISASNTASRGAKAMTVNDIALSGYTRLKINVTSASGAFTLGIDGQASGSFSGTGEHELELGAVTSGKVYVTTTTTSTTATKHVEFDKIWLV